MRIDNPNVLVPHASGAVRADRVLISKTVLAGDATADLTLDPRFAFFELWIEQLVPGTDNTFLYMRVSTDNGASFDAGLASYGWNTYRFNTAGAADQVDASDSEMTLSSSTVGMGNASGESTHGYYLLFRAPTVAYFHVLGQTTWIDDTGLQTQNFMSASYLTASAVVTNIRLLQSSGTLASGTIWLWGIPG